MAEITLVSSLGMEHKDVTGFLKVKQMVRGKISGFTKRLAREWLRIDRSDPKVTRKFHRVEEKGEDGKWVLMHDEQKDFKSRRRQQERPSPLKMPSSDRSSKGGMGEIKSV